MLTDYERYQLEWMIEHGHSLKEFVQGLDLVDLDGIDGLEDAYAIWEQDYGFGGEIFSNEREFNEEDAPALAAAESAPVSYQQAIAAALRKDGWSVIDDSPSPLLIISRESPTTGRTFSVTVPAKGDPDNPLTWLNGFKKLTEEDALIRWKGGRDSYSTLLIGQDIMHFKDGDVAAAVALVAETLGEVIRREGGVTLRDWYMQAYPEDPLGSKINPVDAWFAENGNRRPAWLTARTAPQQPEKIAVAADRRFNLVDARDASGLDLDAEASDVRGVAHDLAPRQPDTPEYAARRR